MRIGTAFGIGLYVHWSFLLIVLMAMSTAMSGDLATAIAVFPLFGCVLLHELGHALMARTFGIGTRDITLLPIGGVARLERMSDRPGEEIAIAVAGPLVNVVIAAGLWLGMASAGVGLPSNLLRMGGPLGERVLAELLTWNVVMVAFNMIPAFPMDGGRVLRAFLSMGFGRLRGTEIAVGVSKLLAMVFILAGLTYFVPIHGIRLSPFLSIIGLFVVFVGNQELAMIRYQGRRNAATLDAVPVATPAYPAAPVQPHFSGFTWDGRIGAWIEWREGRVVGARYVNGAGPQ